jgi:N-hydroxyarylamine O-acetyltransferase
MNIETYLDRIGYDRPAGLNAESLFGLHRTHLLTVPFENLDIHFGKPIHLTTQALWDKIVVRRRGGFCYELNGMFAWLLEQIGFEVTYLNGRVYNKAGERGREFDHLTLLVKIPDEEPNWLVDVGYGDSFFEPLNFDYNGKQEQGLRAYRLDSVEDGFDLLQKDYDGNWNPQYFFDLQARNFPGDYEEGCKYHQTSPQSSFTREPVISLATPDGRITLDSKYLIVTSNGKRIKRKLSGDAEYQELLKYYFGIKL